MKRLIHNFKGASSIGYFGFKKSNRYTFVSVDSAFAYKALEVLADENFECDTQLGKIIFQVKFFYITLNHDKVIIFKFIKVGGLYNAVPL